jgi:oligosaccharide repeat unit polymerase
MDYLMNPLFLFLAVWGTAASLYLAGVCAGTFSGPHGLTVGALLLNVVTFPLGYLTWTLFGRLTPPSAFLVHAPARPATVERMQRALGFCLLMGVSALLLMLYRVARIAAHFHTGFLDLLRQPALLRLGLILFLERGVSQTSLMTKMISLTSAFFAIGFVLLGVFLHLDRTVRRYLYVGGFLFVALATCLTNLSRYDLTVHVLYLVLAYGMTAALSRTELRRVARHLLPPLLTVVLIFVAVELLLRKGEAYGRTQRWSGILYSFYWYLASPIAALNEFLAAGPGGYELGQNTFLPLYKWLHQFHLAPAPDVSIYAEWVFIPHAANVYTYLRNFYEDFGLLGVAVIPYGLGWLLAALHEPARRSFACLNLYVILLVPIIFSFYSYPLLSTQFYLQALFGFVFFRYALVRPGHEDPLLHSG